MQAFAHVVEQAGFGKASLVMGVATPTISRQVQQLETHLGVALLNRTTRRLSLTPDGLHYYDHWKRIFHHKESIVALEKLRTRESRQAEHGLRLVRRENPELFAQWYLLRASNVWSRAVWRETVTYGSVSSRGVKFPSADSTCRITSPRKTGGGDHEFDPVMRAWTGMIRMIILSMCWPGCQRSENQTTPQSLYVVHEKILLDDTYETARVLQDFVLYQYEIGLSPQGLRGSLT
jgi:hypothetical protein